MFELMLSRFGFVVNKNVKIAPRNLLYSGLFASFMCFVLLMTLAGVEIYDKQFHDKLFDLELFSKVLGLMSLAIAPIAFVLGMFLVFTNKLITYLLKVENEGFKWLISILLGCITGSILVIFSGKFILILIAGVTSLWGASFLSLISLSISKREQKQI